MEKLSQELRQEDMMLLYEHKATSKPSIIVAHTKEVFISQCDVNGRTDKEKCGHCFGWFDNMKEHILNNKKCLKREIERKRCRLRYVTHKAEDNARRKRNKRQTWAERADNPKRAIK